jgi:uncharacterized protein (TIGR04255 family)
MDIALARKEKQAIIILRMLEPRHLPNAPISEAVIELRVKPHPAFQISEIERIGQALSETFVDRKTVYTVEQDIEVRNAEMVASGVRHEIEGYQFWTKDHLTAATYRKEAFSFSRLKPYTSWNDMVTGMKPLFQRYRSMAKPQSVVRIGVRFINRIDLPKTLLFEDYLAAPPNVPKDLPQFLSSFLSRVVIHDPEIKVAASVTQALEAKDQDHVTVLLDIDSFKRMECEPDAEEVWTALENLHVFKNKVFFASITEKALSLFT